MAVLIVNATLGIERNEPTYDAHGTLVPGPPAPVDASYPGLVRERGDGGWTLSLDDRLWPVRENDVVVDLDTGRRWTALTADLLRNMLDPIVDYVRVEGRLRLDGGTEPGGAEFVGRP